MKRPEEITEEDVRLALESNQSQPENQYILGICLRDGIGVAPRLNEASLMLSAAAEKEHAGAIYAVAQMYEKGTFYNGQNNVQDAEGALQLYAISAGAGFIPAVEKILDLKERVDLALSSAATEPQGYTGKFTGKADTRAIEVIKALNERQAVLKNIIAHLKQGDIDKAEQGRHALKDGENPMIH